MTTATQMTNVIVPPRGNRLKELREDRGLTQKEVGSIIGIDHSTVSKHESGDRGFTEEEVHKYARVYRCHTFELFFGVGDSKQNGAS